MTKLDCSQECRVDLTELSHHCGMEHSIFIHLCYKKIIFIESNASQNPKDFFVFLRIQQLILK